jgi:predicted amidohydrolase YtcJ
VVARGRGAPNDPIEQWPGLAQAVTRRDRRCAASDPAFGPAEALTLDRVLRAACVDAAISAGELDRGRLSVGHRADIVVLPAAVLAEPHGSAEALAQARPTLVLIDGRVVFER